ncbi:hypothetical protein [Nocardia callitridis]|uniref:Uncharacterized protein n=1 Tax=Nocardia callitridis TaxID=648753 RepID=A0ABP9K0U2_9NOCA
MQRARQPRENHRNAARDHDRDRTHREGRPPRAHLLRDWTIRAIPARSRRRAFRVALGGLALASTVLTSGCDSVSGVPDANSTPAHSDEHTTTERAVSKIVAPQPVEPALPPVSADAPPVGAVPGLPEAAPALQRWATDLTTGSSTDLQAKCWDIAPQNVTDMYADEEVVLAALAQPGVVSENTVTWRSATTTVTAERSAVDTGYACPRVATAGAEVAYNDADARHTVRRYLSRLIGKPLDPSDTEILHPLVCKATPVAWDPTGTGQPTPPPLATNPGVLTGTTAFADQQIRSAWLRADYMSVDVPVTNAAGIQQNRTFTVTADTEGYCIGAVTA